MLNRDPKGKFINRWGALKAWLPLLLERCCGGELDEMLREAAKWCYSQSGRFCESASYNLKKASQGEGLMDDGHTIWPAWAIRTAEVWHKRAAILLDCAAKIKETR